MLNSSLLACKQLLNSGKGENAAHGFLAAVSQRHPGPCSPQTSVPTVSTVHWQPYSSKQGPVLPVLFSQALFPHAPEGNAGSIPHSTKRARPTCSVPYLSFLSCAPEPTFWLCSSRSNRWSPLLQRKPHHFVLPTSSEVFSSPHFQILITPTQGFPEGPSLFLLRKVMFKAWPQEHSGGHTQAKHHCMLDLYTMLYKKKAKEHYMRLFKTQSLVYTWEDILHFSCLCYPAICSHCVQPILPGHSNTREQYFAIYFFLSYFAM